LELLLPFLLESLTRITEKGLASGWLLRRSFLCLCLLPEGPERHVCLVCLILGA
jgi:hypothetical protein